MQGSNSTRLVTVFGGSGFLGRHVVRAFAKKGYRIRVAVRRPDLAGHLQPLGGVGQIHAVQANIRHSGSVARALEGATYAVNLPGVLYSRGKQNFDAVHVDGAVNVARAAAAADIASLVHVSAIGADVTSSSHYARTKGLGEAGVFRECDQAVVLRPSIVFGPEDDFFNRFGALACVMPFLPLIGGGKTLFQPVYVGDVADAVVLAAEGNASFGEVYELGGPSVYSFKALMEKTLEFSGRNCALMPIPFSLAKLQAFFMQIMPSPMLTVDQVKMLQDDNVVSEEAQADARTFDGLGMSHLHSIDTIVPQYFDRFRPKGQFSSPNGV